MANKKSAIKRARQTTRRRDRNVAVRTGVKSARKKLASALQSGDAQARQSAYEDVVSRMDKAAKRGILHRNAVDRHKSRLNSLLAAKPAA